MELPVIDLNCSVNIIFNCIVKIIADEKKYKVNELRICLIKNINVVPPKNSDILDVYNKKLVNFYEFTKMKKSTSILRDMNDKSFHCYQIIYDDLFSENKRKILYDKLRHANIKVSTYDKDRIDNEWFIIGITLKHKYLFF